MMFGDGGPEQQQQLIETGINWKEWIPVISGAVVALAALIGLFFKKRKGN